MIKIYFVIFLKSVLYTFYNIAFLCKAENNVTYRKILDGFRGGYKSLKTIYKIQNISIKGDYT